MRAVRINRLEGPSAVEIAQVPDPRPSGSQVLIEVHYAGVTFPDVLLTRGLYQLRPEPPFTPGSEVAGIVREAPAGAGLEVGDRVAAILGVGAFQELVIPEAAVVFRLPPSFPLDLAAGLPMNYLTVHFALVKRGRLQPGETVLVHGAAGGVGTAAVQLAAALGARVIGVVSTEAKAEVARAAGAHEVIPVDGFKDRARELTGGRGVDVVVDPVGGDRFTDSLRSLAVEGRCLVLGFTGGEIPTVKVNRLLLNNLDVVGVGWGAFFARRPGFLQEQWVELLPLVESGQLKPPLGAVYPLERAGEAIAELEERRATGKLLLKVR
jgi:NADPH2:quinone reductase